MARRKKKFGDAIDAHRERSKSTLREIKRLRGVLKSRLKAPADCEGAIGAALRLAEMSGAYLIDRSAYSSRAGFGGRGVSGILRRFEAKCVVRPKTEAQRRRIRSVWR